MGGRREEGGRVGEREGGEGRRDGAGKQDEVDKERSKRGRKGREGEKISNIHPPLSLPPVV